MKSRSLFWTFAGVFLLVTAVAAALQIVVSVALLRPMRESSARERITHAIETTAREIAALPQAPSDPEWRRLLHAHRVTGGEVVLFFLGHDGRLIPDRPLPPGLPPRARELAAELGLEGATARPPDRGDVFGPGPGGPPEGFGPGAPGGPEGGGPPPEGFGPPSSGLPRGEDAAPRDRRLALLEHEPVSYAGAEIGQLLAVGPAQAGVFSGLDSGWLLWFIPFALLAAAIAGAFMVRIVVHRLRELDRVAARVGDGDLTARVETTGADEIGRLESRFNRMTERLGAARAQLEEGNAQRRRLLANITHELATPLTSIRGYVETLLDPTVETTREERAGYLHDVLEEAKRLDLLIGDLLDLARLEAGAQPLKRVRLDWAALCRNTVRRLEPRFKEAGLRLEWQGGSGEAWIVADGRRFEQVIENLLVNALRYVPSGGTVQLGVERLATGDPPVFRLTVRDDGPGIALDDLPHIFDRFYRARVAREESGSGLGLAIVREIVQQHGGHVRAESLEPRGVAFVVEVPGAA